jgi:hypothetical protein
MAEIRKDIDADPFKARNWRPKTPRRFDINDKQDAQDNMDRIGRAVDAIFDGMTSFGEIYVVNKKDTAKDRRNDPLAPDTRQIGRRIGGMVLIGGWWLDDNRGVGAVVQEPPPFNDDPEQLREPVVA